MPGSLLEFSLKLTDVTRLEPVECRNFAILKKI
jgi:hypothetical protein